MKILPCDKPRYVSTFSQADFTATVHPEPAIVPLSPRSSHPRTCGPVLYQVILLTVRLLLPTQSPERNGRRIHSYPRQHNGEARVPAGWNVSETGEAGAWVDGTRI